MPKRRRERDKPKAGPGTGYDPNKRVHLAYDDDDEPVSTGQEPGESIICTGYESNVTASAVVPKEPEGAKDGADGAAPPDHGEDTGAKVIQKESDAMPKTADTKLNASETVALPIAEVDDDEYDPAESLKTDAPLEGVSQSLARKKPPQQPNARPGKNQATNMKPALGSLSYQWEDDGSESCDSEEDEAMAYLRSVREARQAMPTVFVAPKEEAEEDLYEKGDNRGYMVEDCYIARPTVGPSAPARTYLTPREAYTLSLIHI